MREDVTEDRLLGGKVVLRQPRDGYRVAIDPVLLAAAVDARPGQRVLDLGTGTGAAALCLMARVSDLGVVGVEIDAATAALARDNARLNGRSAYDVRVGDIAELPADLRGFDHVISNPPYLERERASPSPNPERNRSNVEAAGLGPWIEAALRAGAPRGTVTLIQRADRLADLLGGLGGRAGVTVVPIWPKAGTAAGRVIVRARLGRRSPLVIHPGVVMHAHDGQYTDIAAAILRGEALELD